MAKTRMTSRLRTLMITHAREATEAYISSTEVDAAYTLAAMLVTKAIHNVFPVADMEVLAKYDSTRQTNRAKMVSADGRRHFGFAFDQAITELSLTPNSTHNGDIGEVSEEVSHSCQVHEQLEDARDAKVDELYGTYVTLINTANNIEAIIDQWPACSKYAQSITGSTAVSALSQEAMNLITMTNVSLEEV